MTAELVLAPFRLPAWGTSVLFAALGALLTWRLSRRALADCGEPDRGWSGAAALAGFLLCGAFTWCMLVYHVQQTPIVRPTEVWWYWRIGYHVVLIALMLAATTTDLRAYLIPDRITWGGLAFGVVLAALSGDLQIEQLWVDWNQEVPQLRGPYIPEWIAIHRHVHGAAWSLAGAAFGLFSMWLIRALASLALGQEAMGFGDVTLMAMIGSFLGWQATAVVLLLAPVCGLVIGGLMLVWRSLRYVAARIHPAWRPTGPARSYLPYGPLLCLATYVVLLSWRWIWMFELQLGRASREGDRLSTFAVRRLFGDWPSLLLIAGITLAAIAIVLFLRRLYRNLPVRRRSADEALLPDASRSEGGDSAEPPAEIPTETRAEPPL